MKTFQFAHLEIYSRQVSGQSRNPNNKKTVYQIINEVCRKRLFCSHIDEPKEPVHLEGCQAREIAENLDKYLVNNPIKYRSKSTSLMPARKPRNDSFVLLAAVYSYPTPTTTHDSEDAMAFFRETLNFHRRKFGTVDSALLHLDEHYPHIHVYSFSNNAKLLHPGHAAKKLGKEIGLKGKEISPLYNIAMSKWQDDFSEEVTKYFGMERTGPRRPRLDRQTHLKNKKIEEYGHLLEDEKIKNRKLKKQLDQTAQCIVAMEQNLRRLTEQLKNAEDLIQEKDSMSEVEKRLINELEAINQASQKEHKKISDENSQLIRYIQAIDPNFSGDIAQLDNTDDSLMRM